MIGRKELIVKLNGGVSRHPKHGKELIDYFDENMKIIAGIIVNVILLVIVTGCVSM